MERSMVQENSLGLMVRFIRDRFKMDNLTEKGISS